MCHYVCDNCTICMWQLLEIELATIREWLLSLCMWRVATVTMYVATIREWLLSLCMWQLLESDHCHYVCGNY